jgi:hypothetical protein
LSLQGYGITLGAINGLNVLSSILQAIPNLQVQVLTLLTWMVSRFFMYSRCNSSAAAAALLYISSIIIRSGIIWLIGPCVGWRVSCWRGHHCGTRALRLRRWPPCQEELGLQS